MKLILAFCFIFFSFISSSQSIYGRVSDDDTKKSLANANVYLAVIDNTEDTTNIYYFENLKHRVLAQTVTDSFGLYSFNSLTPAKYNIIADFCLPYPEKYGGGYGLRQTIDSNVVVNSNTRYSRNFSLRATCPYDKTKDQKFCPVCKQSDKVKLILYGVPMYDEKGDFPEGYFFGSCIIDVFCDPTKHCDRCNKFF